MTRPGLSAPGTTLRRSRMALLLIDVINAMDFDGSERLVRQALPAARCIAALKRRLRAAEVPVIYVNDNFGRWKSDFRQQVEHCMGAEAPGRRIAELLLPEEEDYFVLKPKHSGFFSTTLGVLLDHLEVDTLVLTGFAGNLCVLYTANDAYMRDYRLHVPADCVASESRHDNRLALEHMSRHLRADVRPSRHVRAPRRRRRRG